MSLPKAVVDQILAEMDRKLKHRHDSREGCRSINTDMQIMSRVRTFPPLRVQSRALVRNLNAEFLGGRTAAQIISEAQFASGVSSLGELGDPVTLTGAVKLKEGLNVSITRDDVNNALEIAAAGAAGAPADLTYVTKLDESAQLPNSIQHQNLSGTFLHDPKPHKASHAAGGSDSFVDQIIRLAKLEIDLNTVYIDKDASDNMIFTDPVTGTKTLAQLAEGGGSIAILQYGEGAAGAQTSGTTRYFINPRGSTPQAEANCRLILPRAGTLRNMYVRASFNNLNGTTTITVLLNGTETTLQVALAAGALSGSDTTHTVTIAAGDQISIRSTTGGTSGEIDNLTVAMEFA